MHVLTLTRTQARLPATLHARHGVKMISMTTIDAAARTLNMGLHTAGSTRFRRLVYR